MSYDELKGIRLEQLYNLTLPASYVKPFADVELMNRYELLKYIHVLHSNIGLLRKEHFDALMLIRREHISRVSHKRNLK